MPTRWLFRVEVLQGLLPGAAQDKAKHKTGREVFEMANLDARLRILSDVSAALNGSQSTVAS